MKPQVLALTKIGGAGDHLQPALPLEPNGDHGDIDTAGTGKDDTFDLGVATPSSLAAPLAGA